MRKGKYVKYMTVSIPTRWGSLNCSTFYYHYSLSSLHKHHNEQRYSFKTTRYVRPTPGSLTLTAPEHQQGMESSKQATYNDQPLKHNAPLATQISDLNICSSVQPDNRYKVPDRLEKNTIENAQSTTQSLQENICTNVQSTHVNPTTADPHSSPLQRF
jgi:hypothetical protein